MTFDVDSQKWAGGPAAVLAALAGLMVPAIGLIKGFVDLGEADRWLWLGLQVFAVVLAAAGIVVALAFRPAAPKDFLRLDREGITLARWGKSRSWRWPEISDIALRSRPWRGLRIRTGGMRRETVTIGDLYLTPLEEIAARLSDYRDQALGAKRRSAAPAVRGHERRALAEQATFRIRRPEAPAAILAAKSAPALIGFVLVFAVAGFWGFGRPAISPHLLSYWHYGLIFAAVVVLAVWGLALLVHVSRHGEAANYLTLSDEGLSYARGGQELRWLWRDLSAFELRDGGQGVEPVIVFAARDQGLQVLSGMNAPVKREHDYAFAIRDCYDTPAAEIVKQLNQRRSRALEYAAGQAEPESRQENSSLARPIRVRKCLGALGRSGALDGPVLAVLLSIDIAVLVAWLPLVVDLLDDDSLDIVNFFLVMVLPLLGILALAMPAVLLASPGSNYLQLAADGLTYARMGRRKRWAWNELSDVQLSSAKTLWAAAPRALVTFRAPGDDWQSRLLRRCYGLNGAGPAVVIEDVYDVPPEEIARRLGEWQARSTTS